MVKLVDQIKNYVIGLKNTSKNVVLETVFGSLPIDARVKLQKKYDSLDLIFSAPEKNAFFETSSYILGTYLTGFLSDTVENAFVANIVIGLSYYMLRTNHIKHEKITQELLDNIDNVDYGFGSMFVSPVYNLIKYVSSYFKNQ